MLSEKNICIAQQNLVLFTFKKAYMLDLGCIWLMNRSRFDWEKFLLISFTHNQQYAKTRLKFVKTKLSFFAGGAATKIY